MFTRGKPGFVHVGFGNLVNNSRIVAVEPLTNNITELNRCAILEDEGLILHQAYGRRIKSVIVMDSGHLILSAASPEEIKRRMR